MNGRMGGEPEKEGEKADELACWLTEAQTERGQDSETGSEKGRSVGGTTEWNVAFSALSANARVDWEEEPLLS